MLTIRIRPMAKPPKITRFFGMVCSMAGYRYFIKKEWPVTRRITSKVMIKSRIYSRVPSQ